MTNGRHCGFRGGWAQLSTALCSAGTLLTVTSRYSFSARWHVRVHSGAAWAFVEPFRQHRMRGRTRFAAGPAAAEHGAATYHRGGATRL